MAWYWDGGICAWISSLQRLISREVNDFPNDLEAKPRILHEIYTYYDFRTVLSIISFETRSNRWSVFVNLTAIFIFSFLSNMQELHDFT